MNLNLYFDLRSNADLLWRNSRSRSAGTIGYEVSGTDREIPILLIRPLGGSIALWGAFRTLLERDFRVIAFDLRGTGRSSRTHEWATTRRLASDALRVLDELDVEEADVFGLSLGGMIATWLSIIAPSRVRKLCIASAPARGVDLQRAGLRRELHLLNCFARREVELHLVWQSLSPSFRRRNPELLHRIADTLRRNPSPRGSLFELALASTLHDTAGKLNRIRAETLVLAGQNDKLLGTDCSRVLARAIPRATFEVVPDCGHDLTLEQPEVTAERLARFLQA
jgi:pimeloyl-ACP methyl ester carboxylesterase